MTDVVVFPPKPRSIPVPQYDANRRLFSTIATIAIPVILVLIDLYLWSLVPALHVRFALELTVAATLVGISAELRLVALSRPTPIADWQREVERYAQAIADDMTPTSFPVFMSDTDTSTVTVALTDPGSGYPQWLTLRPGQYDKIGITSGPERLQVAWRAHIKWARDDQGCITTDQPVVKVIPLDRYELYCRMSLPSRR